MRSPRLPKGPTADEETNRGAQVARIATLKQIAAEAGVDLGVLLPAVSKGRAGRRRALLDAQRALVRSLKGALKRHDGEHRRLHREILNDWSKDCRARGTCSGPRFMQSHSFMCGQLAADLAAERAKLVEPVFTETITFRSAAGGPEIVAHETGQAVEILMDLGFQQRDIALLCLTAGSPRSGALPVSRKDLDEERDRLKTALHEYRQARRQRPTRATRSKNSRRRRVPTR